MQKCECVQYWMCEITNNFAHSQNCSHVSAENVCNVCAGAVEILAH